jgi:glyoxylase-like metal-dependent hydrolase (beta-lactamase superfamily II)
MIKSSQFVQEFARGAKAIACGAHARATASDRMQIASRSSTPMKTIFAATFLGLLVVVASLSPAANANPFEYAWQELAPGVWSGTRDPFELPQEGNATFVVTDDGVVVFDAGGSPLMGESIVAKVRSLTSTSITHVILSHWHGDHMRGLQAIQAAFPVVQIFAHPFSRDFIASTRERWLERRVKMVPNIQKALSDALAKNQDLSGRPLIASEKAWLEQGLANLDQLDRENKRTSFVVPNATIADRLILRLGGREIRFLHPGNAHTAGDIIMWLPKEKVVATGDIVTAPVPLMPSPYINDYVRVLNAIKALGFETLVPGHGAIEHDSKYLDLMIDAIENVSAQLRRLTAQGLSAQDALAKIDLSAIELEFTHGDAFLKHRFEDYMSTLPQAAVLAASGKTPDEKF